MFAFCLMMLLAALIVVTRRQVKQPSPTWRTAQGVLLALMTMGLIVQGVRGCRGPNPTSSHAGFEQAAGYRLGQLVSAGGYPQGTVLVLQWKDANPWAKRLAAAQLDGLQEGLKESGLTIAVEGPELPSDPDQVEKLLFAPSPVTMEKVEAWIVAHEEVVALVAFLEAPPLLEPKMISKLPPIYLKGPAAHPRLERLVARGFLKAVVVDKVNIKVQEEPPAGLDLDALFDVRFDLLTAAKYGRSPSGSRPLLASRVTRDAQ